MKLKTIGASIVAATLLTTSNTLLARDTGSMDDTGPYIGVLANWISADFEDRNDVDFDDSDAAAGIRAGYMFNDIFGIEVEYLDLGDYQAGDTPQTRIDLDADAFTAAAVFNWSVADKFDVYGKIGAYYVDAESNSIVAGIPFRESDDDVSPFIAVGVEYDMGTWNLFGEYSIADTDAHDLALDVISVGVKYEFGKLKSR